jgi:hypothetical protein
LVKNFLELSERRSNLLMLAHHPQAEFQGMFHQKVVALLQTRVVVVLAAAAFQGVLLVQVGAA